jgi:hypothetical protein
MTNIDESLFSIPATGDSVTGDIILFTEAVFGGSHRSPKFLGDRRVVARIIKDSYGSAKQQHTFSLEIIASDGYQPLTAGAKTTRKGRNVYRNGTARLPWEDETARKIALDEKHGRGDAARSARDARKEAF